MKFFRRLPEEDRPLFGFQHNTKEMMKENALNGRDYHGLFFQMRLGKTLTTIRYAKEMGLKKNLIIAPLSIIEPTWKKELELEKLPYFQFTRAALNPKFQARLPYKYETIHDLWHLENLWVVANYEFVRSDKGLFSEVQWDLVCVDEATKLANPNNKISKFCAENFRSAKSRMILGGNPTPNDLAEYFQQVKFLKGDFLGYTDYHKFVHSHFTTNGGNKLIPYTRSLPQLEAELKQFCYKIRRQDVNVGSKKVYETKVVELAPQYRKQYDEMELMWALNETETEWIIVCMNYLHQMAGGEPHFDKSISARHKLDEVFDLLDGDLKDEKVVFWCNFRYEQRRLYEHLSRKYPETAIINGGTPIVERTRIIQQFQETSNYNLLLATYGTLDFGIDLSAADTMIYWSLPWSRLKREQSEDRIIHPKKTYPVLYIDIVAKDTIDVDILMNHQDKIRRTDSFNDRIYQSMLHRVLGADGKLNNSLQPSPDFSAKVEKWKSEKLLEIGK